MKGGAIKGSWPLAAAAAVGATMFGVVQLLFPVSDVTHFDAGPSFRPGTSAPPRVFTWPEPPAAAHTAKPRVEVERPGGPDVVAEQFPPYTDNVQTSTGEAEAAPTEPKAAPTEPEPTPTPPEQPPA